MVTFSLTTHLWILWARIAIEHEMEARAARQAGLAAASKGEFLERETMACMVAISAAAHAVDALYATWKPYAKLPIENAASSSGKKRPTRWRQVAEVIRRVLNANQEADKHNREELKWLYKSRDSAVHYREESGPPVAHPLGTGTSKTHVDYSLENANRAILLLLVLMQTAKDQPSDSLEPWTQSFADAMAELINSRQG